MLKFKFLFLLLCVIICSCNKEHKNNNNSLFVDSTFVDSILNDSLLIDTLPLDPFAIICLQPYDDFTQKEAYSLCKKIQQGLNAVYAGDWSNIKILPNKPLPKEAYYKTRNRYLANIILKDLPKVSSPIYIIGLTHKDISYKIHGSKNYGIMGLTPLGRQKSIVSDYRVKNDDFIAVIVHEFGHGFYGAKHCSNTNCIMCDYQKLKRKSFNFSLCKEHEFMN